MKTPWNLALFGALIGLLTTLSTAAGTTVTLIGLLFALIGSSILSWFDKQKISDADRPFLLAYAGHFALGTLIGLVIGFGLRWVDQRFILPDIHARQLAVARDALTDPLEKLSDAIGSLQQAHRSGKVDNPDSDSALATSVADLKVVVAELGKLPLPSPSFELHAAEVKEMNELVTLLNADAAATGPVNAKTKLTDLAASVNALALLIDSQAEVEVLKKTMSDETRRSFERLFR